VSGAGNTISGVRILVIVGCAAIGAFIGVWASWPVFQLAVLPGTAPRSRCPTCDEPLPAGWRGWTRHGGCPACHRAAPRSWPYVVAATAGFAALAWRLPAGTSAGIALLVAWLVMTGVDVVLAGVDAAVHRLPRPLLASTAPVLAALIGVAAVAARDPQLLVRAGLTAAALGTVYLILALVGAGLVGLGDVYLAALLGLLLGTGPLAVVVVGAVAPYLLGAPVTAIRLALGRIHRRSHVVWRPT
jgi:leader peptidase (prepilin peptidase) / N-methyltransferase